MIWLAAWRVRTFKWVDDLSQGYGSLFNNDKKFEDEDLILVEIASGCRDSTLELQREEDEKKYSPSYCATAAVNTLFYSNFRAVSAILAELDGVKDNWLHLSYRYHALNVHALLGRNSLRVLKKSQRNVREVKKEGLLICFNLDWPLKDGKLLAHPLRQYQKPPWSGSRLAFDH